jgi:hypothetical protein
MSGSAREYLEAYIFFRTLKKTCPEKNKRLQIETDRKLAEELAKKLSKI